MYAAFEQARDEAIGEGRLAGAVAMTLDRGGVVYESAAGRRSSDGVAPMTPDTIFWVASMTKAIASVAALQLVERGKLSLDGDLTGLVPEFADLQVFDRQAADGSWTTRPAKRAPTLRELLTHTSGFSYGFIDPRINPWLAARQVQGGTRAWHSQPLLFDPGEGWAYGVGIDWAGLAVEAASGQRLDAYIAEHITGPLSMTDTVFVMTPEQKARAAGMHTRTPEGGLAPMPFAMPETPEVFGGGGGLHSTVSDYGRFLRILLDGGAPLLSPETVADLGRAHSGPHRAGAWTTAQAHLSRDFDLFPGMATGWGLIGGVNPEPGPYGRSAGSLAWGGLPNCYYWADPTAGKAGVLMTQVLPFGDTQVLDLFASLERGAYA